MRDIEYQMTKQMFDAFLADRTESEKKANPYQYVMDVINRQFGLIGQVKRLFII